MKKYLIMGDLDHEKEFRLLQLMNEIVQCKKSCVYVFSVDNDEVVPVPKGYNKDQGEGPTIKGFPENYKLE